MASSTRCSRTRSIARRSHSSTWRRLTVNSEAPSRSRNPRNPPPVSIEANCRSSPTGTTLAPARRAWSSSGASLRVPTMPASSITSTVRAALVVEAHGGDPGGGGADDLVAVQLERLTGQPQRPRLAGARAAHHQRDARAGLAHVAHHRLLVRPAGGVALQHLPHRRRAHDPAAVLVALDRGADQAPLEGEQLRRRVALHAEPLVARDRHGTLVKEPVGDLLELRHALLNRPGDGEPLGELVHYVGAGEGARLRGQPLRAGEGVQGRLDLFGTGGPAAAVPAQH